MKSETIKINGESLSYLDSQQGEKTLLFIHGAFINKEYWTHQLSYFSDKYRVVAIDLAGHGKSTRNRMEWTVQNYGKDVNGFIQDLQLKNVILIGHSMGSDVMLETIAIGKSPIIGLVEIDHMKNVGATLPEEAIEQLGQKLEADFETSCEQYARQALVTEGTDLELVSKLLKDYGRMKPHVGIPLLKNGFNYPTRETELLKGLELTLHLIHVNYTPTDEDSLKKYLGNNYELHIIDGTCHYPMLENPDNLNKVLEKIFSKI